VPLTRGRRGDCHNSGHARKKSAVWRCVSATYVFLLCGLLQSHARADVSVTFPLEGHYRPGRFMPVHFVASAVNAPAITLTSDGAIPLTIPTTSGGVDVTAPWLAISSSLQNAHWTDIAEHTLPTSLLPLTDNQRLVALAGINASQARAVVPTGELITIQLDVTNPLPGNPCAWEALDALLLDETSAARVTDRQLRVLLAAGTTVAVRSQRRPDRTWPWQKNGAFWVIAHARIGPQSLIEPAAYGPTYGWIRGVPDSIRRQSVLAGVVVAVLLVGASLLRGWHGAAGVVSVAILTSIGWVVWQSHHPPANRLAANIVVNDGSLSQRDHWTWISSPVALTSGFPADGLTHPIFFTRSMVERSNMSLCVPADGKPMEFRFSLQPRLAIAFVSSTVGTEVDQHSLEPAHGSFASMAQDVYGNQDANIIGRYSSAGETVIVCDRKQTPLDSH
jgi:hypothetical protein